MQFEAHGSLPVTLRAQKFTHVLGLCCQEGLSGRPRRRQLLSGPNAELAHHIFLADASDEIWLVARDKDAANAVKRLQPDMKTNPVAFRQRGDRSCVSGNL